MGTGPDHSRPDMLEPSLFIIPKKGVAVFPGEKHSGGLREVILITLEA